MWGRWGVEKSVEKGKRKVGGVGRWGGGEKKV